MKNTFGNSITYTLYGESHGASVGIVMDGLAPGITVSDDRIRVALARRRPSTAADTARREADNFRIISGVFHGKTTGTPLCIDIPNEDARSTDYSYGIARPSHADYAANRRYNGFEDYRGGGHFSGRITAAVVAASGILMPALEGMEIRIGTHILRCGSVGDRPFGDIESDVELLRSRSMPVLDEDAADAMTAAIKAAGSDGDSIGGITQTIVSGIPAGVGEPWFDSVEGMLSHAVFSIGGVKGIEFGSGFDAADMRGSAFNDAMRMQNGSVVTVTNHNGGVNGGLTNGMPVVFRCAVKPTPSIAVKQETVDFVHRENAEISVKGRHDPAILRRICPVLDGVTAMVVCDLLAQRFGTDVLTKGVSACSTD